MSKKLPSQFSSDDNSNSEIKRQIFREQIRRASWSFNALLLLIFISAVLSFTGVGLLFSGKISDGVATTAGGLSGKIVSLHLLKLNKEANDNLNRIAKELKDED